MFSDEIHDESPLNWALHLQVKEQEREASSRVCVLQHVHLEEKMGGVC